MIVPISSPSIPLSSPKDLKRSRSLGFAIKRSEHPLEKLWPTTPPPLPCNLKKQGIPLPFPCNSKQSTRYSVSLHDRSNQASITLNIYNTREISVFPIYNEGEKISGNVELKIERSMQIQEVLVSARGRINSPGKHGKPFVQMYESLWAAGILVDDACRRQRSDASTAQLTGSFTWPFSLELPAFIPSTTGAHQKMTTQQLPPSFSTNDVRSSIQYDVAVIIKGSKEISLSSPFIYAPLTRPPPLPSLRAFAYEENTALLGPQVDIEGWEVYPSFVIRGVAFTAYTVDVRCTLALANPLSYTRGSVIPCLLTLESSDLQILHLLYNPGAPRLQLCRQVESSAGIEKIAKIFDAIKHPSRVVSTARWALMDSTHSHEDCAVRPIADTMYSRTLSGELYLPENITPSFSFRKMSLKYSVQLLPFDVAGFLPADGENAIFFQRNVEITSDYAEGTRPRAYLSHPDPH